MENQRQAMRLDALLIFLLIYTLASLIHFVHNGVFLDEYPNMPAWLSSAKVYAAWLGITTIGLVGYGLVRRGYEVVGLLVVGVYAVLGFDGFGHYRLAPLSAHSLTMNLTIWLEAATALALLITVTVLTAMRWRKAQNNVRA